MVHFLFEVRVACFIFNKEGKLLLLKNRQGTWGILGGHVERGESAEGTVHREAMEEASIKVKIIGSLGTWTVKDSFIVGFACKFVSGKIKLQEEEVSDFKWVELSELDLLNLTFKELPFLAKEAKVIFGKSLFSKETPMESTFGSLKKKRTTKNILAESNRDDWVE